MRGKRMPKHEKTKAAPKSTVRGSGKGGKIERGFRAGPSTSRSKRLEGKPI